MAIGWEDIDERLDRNPRRDAQHRAARWAIATLRERLGDDWLERAAERSDGALPLGLRFPSGNNLALVEALEWALRLEACRGWDGGGAFLRDLVNDPRPARILHSRSQLAQASFAERLGWRVALEPKRGGTAPADLSFEGSAGLVVTEVRVLFASDRAREQRAAAEGVSDWLFGLGLQHRVWIGGRVEREPDEDEREEIEEFVKQKAERIQPGRRARFAVPGISLEIADRGESEPPLVSPPVREELFARMVRAIAAKAEKMSKSGAQWLHVTVLTGLWPFTVWGLEPLDRKLPSMSSALAAALGERGPAGIILTSAASLSGAPEELARGEAGIALRVPVQPLRARESLILPLREGVGRAKDDWLALTRAESDWVDWALARQGLPDLAAILAPQE